MYSKKEAALLKKDFWTSFGLYMKPLPDASGETINWLNYKTGFKHLYFRMDADNTMAGISIEIRHPDPAERERLFQKFHDLKSLLHEITSVEWDWQLNTTDEHDKTFSRIVSTLDGVNVLDKSDWPAIITFLKPRLIGLDNFWNIVKEGFEF